MQDSRGALFRYADLRILLNICANSYQQGSRYADAVTFD